MDKKSFFLLLKEILLIVLISMIGCVGIIFSVLYLDTFESDFFLRNKTLFVALIVGVISILTILTISFMRGKKGFVYKLFVLITIFISVVSLSLYILDLSGFLDKVDSVEDLRKFISSYGNSAVILFIIVQFAQVVFIPIPSVITIGAGVLLFGALKNSVYSCIGIIIGSILAYFIGKLFGHKVVKWLIGEEALEKALKTIKGKDSLILPFFFLLPFFPDDIICFVAGLTTVSPKYFVIMIIVVRIITITISSYSLSNSFIPYDTWWGLVVWGVLLLCMIFLTIFIYRKGDKINEFVNKRIRKNKDKSN